MLICLGTLDINCLSHNCWLNVFKGPGTLLKGYSLLSFFNNNKFVDFGMQHKSYSVDLYTKTYVCE